MNAVNQKTDKNGQNLGEGLDAIVAAAQSILDMAARLGHRSKPSGAQTNDSGNNNPPPPPPPNPGFGG